MYPTIIIRELQIKPANRVKRIFIFIFVIYKYVAINAGMLESAPPTSAPNLG